MLSLLKNVQNATITESSKTEQSKQLKSKQLKNIFVLAFFTTKSSRNSLKFVCQNSALLMHRMLSVGNLSWNIAAL